MSGSRQIRAQDLVVDGQHMHLVREGIHCVVFETLAGAVVSVCVCEERRFDRPYRDEKGVFGLRDGRLDTIEWIFKPH